MAIQAQTMEERIQQLEKRVLQQKEQIHQLENQLPNTEDYKQYTDNIVKEYLQESFLEDERIAITAGYEKGFFIRNAEGTIEFKLSGYSQIGVGIFENNSVDNNSFFFNTTYLNFDAYIFKDWHARLILNVAQADGYYFQGDTGFDNIEIRDCYIEYTGIKEFQVRIGNSHIPFSMEGGWGNLDTLAVFHTPLIGWSHGRDMGVTISGMIDDYVCYSTGIFNGDGSLNLDNDDEFLTAAKLNIFYQGKQQHPNNYFHIAAMANRRDNTTRGHIDQACIKTSWCRLLRSIQTDDWKLGLDIGARYETKFQEQHALRFEAEGMAIRWDRCGVEAEPDPHGNLVGYGAMAGVQYKYILHPDQPKQALFLGLQWSYVDLDNHGGANMSGQTIYTYTGIVGYDVNEHFRIEFNWVIADIDDKVYNGQYGAKNKGDKSGSLEQAWFLQVTAMF